MKLNLGSNTVRIAGYLNLDMRCAKGVDIIDDVGCLCLIDADSCDAIIAHNILEHFAYDRTLDIVRLWVSKLSESGALTIGVPDASLIFARYAAGQCTRAKYSGHPWQDLNHSIFGNMDSLRKWHGDDADKYGHHAAFCRDHLEWVMQHAGLSDIETVKPNHNDNVTLRGVRKTGGER